MTKTQKKTMIIVWIIIGLSIIRGIFNWQKSLLDDKLDAARSEYRSDVTSFHPYDVEADPYVLRVSIVDIFDDRVYSDSIIHTDQHKYGILMDDSFDSLSLRERCDKCVQIMDEIRPKLYDHFEDSRYYKIYSMNHHGGGMKYRGKWLDANSSHVFLFFTNNNEYTFPSYGDMTVSARGTDVKKDYEYHTDKGHVVEIGDRYASHSTEDGKKKSSGSSSGTYRKSTKKSSSDPYDVYKYKSAQDFADDKYEDFYEYEDDYEDEDEAYDAAEDYWYDYND